MRRDLLVWVEDLELQQAHFGFSAIAVDDDDVARWTLRRRAVSQVLVAFVLDLHDIDDACRNAVSLEKGVNIIANRLTATAMYLPSGLIATESG